MRLQRGNFTGAEQLQRQLEQMAASFRMDAEHPCQRAIVMSASSPQPASSRQRLVHRKPAFYWLRDVLRSGKSGDRLTTARLRTLQCIIGLVMEQWQTAAARTTFQPVVQLAEQQHLTGLFLDAGDTITFACRYE